MRVHLPDDLAFHLPLTSHFICISVGEVSVNFMYIIQFNVRFHDFYCATLCISAVFAIVRCPSVTQVDGMACFSSV